MGFSRSARASPVASCANSCIDAKAADQILIHGARQRAAAISRIPAARGSMCATRAPQVQAAASRMERYNAALPAARAARDLNELGNRNSGALNQPCITRLPLDAAALNRELGIDPNSPNAITDLDLRNDRTGYRAALYRDETSGQIIMVSRDTQPHSLVDWKANIDNGQGIDTDQYQAARNLSRKLSNNNVNFDVAGYSKGGGLAQEAGLVSPRSNVYVFNSSGLHPNSLARTGARDFSSLTSRTSAFSSQGDFLTYMNNTGNPQQQLTNAQFLREHLAGPTGFNPSAWKKPMQIQHLNPRGATPEGTMSTDAAFLTQRGEFLGQLDTMIRNRQVSFPPVRAATQETIPNSIGSTSGISHRLMGANSDQPTLGKLAQHKIDNIVGTRGHPGSMENQIAADRNLLKTFRAQCGG